MTILLCIGTVIRNLSIKDAFSDDVVRLDRELCNKYNLIENPTQEDVFNVFVQANTIKAEKGHSHHAITAANNGFWSGDIKLMTNLELTNLVAEETTYPISRVINCYREINEKLLQGD